MTTDVGQDAGMSVVPVGPGAILRGERERQSLSIDSVAKTMNVTTDLVVALETNDFGFFDAPVFARGYLRQYGSLLSLATDQLLAAYAGIADDVLSTPSLIPPMRVEPIAPQWLRWKRPFMWAAAALVVLLLGLWSVRAMRGIHLSFGESDRPAVAPAQSSDH